MSALAFTISLAGVLQFLIAVAVLVLLIVGARWLLSLAGVSVPQPIWAILGFILFLIILLYALGIFGGGGGVSFR